MKTDKLPISWTRRTNGRSQVQLPGPGHPAPGTSPTAAAQPPSTISDRTSGASPGHPAPRQSPDIRPFPRKSGINDRTHPKFGHFSPDIRPEPGHPATREAPDIRPPARTSGACLRTTTGQRIIYLTFPLTPSWLRLYILLPLLLVRVSKVIAHLIESFAPCTTLLLRERERLLLHWRPRPPSRRRSSGIYRQDPFM